MKIAVLIIVFILSATSGNSQAVSELILLHKNASALNCNSVQKTKKGFLYLTSQSGSYSFNGKSTEKIPFGKPFDSLFETGNSKRLVYNENAQQLVCCYPKYGIAILNRINSKSFFQLLKIDGFNPSEEVSGLEYIGSNYVLNITNKLIVFGQCRPIPSKDF